MADQTSGMFMRVASIEMRKPRPAVGEPKNSATMAPIRASVALTLSALKMKGSAAGRRRSSSVRFGLAAYECISSRSNLPAACRPASVLTSAGKKVIRMMTAAFDGQSKPNHMTAIGATPTSGIVLVSEAIGSRPRCRKGERSMAKAVPIPRPQPSV